MKSFSALSSITFLFHLSSCASPSQRGRGCLGILTNWPTGSRESLDAQVVVLDALTERFYEFPNGANIFF